MLLSQSPTRPRYILMKKENLREKQRIKRDWNKNTIHGFVISNHAIIIHMSHNQHIIF